MNTREIPWDAWDSPLFVRSLSASLQNCRIFSLFSPAALSVVTWRMQALRPYLLSLSPQLPIYSPSSSSNRLWCPGLLLIPQTLLNACLKEHPLCFSQWVHAAFRVIMTIAAHVLLEKKKPPAILIWPKCCVKTACTQWACTWIIVSPYTYFLWVDVLLLIILCIQQISLRPQAPILHRW